MVVLGDLDSDICIDCGAHPSRCHCTDDGPSGRVMNQEQECPHGCDLATYGGTHAGDCPLLPDERPVGSCTCVCRAERTCEIPSHRAAAVRRG